jgi:hypothetical protein
MHRAFVTFPGDHIWFYHDKKDKNSGIFPAEDENNSQLPIRLKPKQEKDLRLHIPILLIRANDPSPCRGYVFSE